MASFGLHGKKGIECNYTVHLGYRYTKVTGNLALHLLRQIAEVTLALMQDVDQFTGSVAELRAYLGDLVLLTFVQFYLIHN